jgi:hypothetical protein
MSGVTYFYESCPVCGRQLRIPVQHFGRLMECSHCGGEFVAGQPVPQERPCAEQSQAIEPTSGALFRAPVSAQD